MAGLRGTFRALYSELFDEARFQALTSDAKLLLLTLKLGPAAGLAGMFVVYRATLAAQTGLSPKRLERGLAELQGSGWLEVDGLVHWLVDGITTEPTISLENGKQVSGIWRQLLSLPPTRLLARFLARHPELTPPSKLRARAEAAIPIGMGIDRVSVGSPRLASVSVSVSVPEKKEEHPPMPLKLSEGPPPGSSEFKRRWAVASQRDREQAERAAAARERKPGELVGSSAALDEVLPISDRGRA